MKFGGDIANYLNFKISFHKFLVQAHFINFWCKLCKVVKIKRFSIKSKVKFFSPNSSIEILILVQIYTYSLKKTF